MQGLVANIQKFSIHDGPGIRTTVFVKGCPLRCKWCSNPEAFNPYPEIMFRDKKCRESGKCIEICPEGAITMDRNNKIDGKRCTRCMECVEACKYGALEKVGVEMTPEEVVKVVEEDMPFYKSSNGGLTMCGGEPLMQADFTAEVFKLCKRKNIHTVLDTSGFAKPEDVEKVLKYTDLVLLDIKHMDPVVHKRWTGASNELILKNAELMAKRTEVRISLPLVKGVNDSEKNVKETVEFSASLGIRWIDVEPFHTIATAKYKSLGLENPYTDFVKFSDEEVEEIRGKIKSWGLRTTKGRAII
jgi:pyruvate formate lyase activating enzyme